MYSRSRVEWGMRTIVYARTHPPPGGASRASEASEEEGEWLEFKPQRPVTRQKHFSHGHPARQVLPHVACTSEIGTPHDCADSAPAQIPSLRHATPLCHSEETRTICPHQPAQFPQDPRPVLPPVSPPAVPHDALMRGHLISRIRAALSVTTLAIALCLAGPAHVNFGRECNAVRCR